MDNQGKLLFSEIVNGFSRAQNYYISHPSYSEYFELLNKYEKHLARAVKNGILTQQEAVNRAIENDWWAIEDEKRIQNFYPWIENQEKTFKKLNLERDKKPFQEQIKKDKAILETYLLERKRLIGTTAEEYAMNRFNNDAISRFFYKDLTLTQRLDEDEIDEQFDFLSREYHNFVLRFDDENIKLIAAGGFFLNQLSIFGDDISDYFGVAPAKMTKFQFELLKYAKFIQCRIRNLTMDNITIDDEIYADPEKLIKFCEATHKKNDSPGPAKENTVTHTANFV